MASEDLSIPGRQWILRKDGRIEPCDDVAEFAAWFEEQANRRIDRTAVPYGENFKEAVIVSTVFLGFEHGSREGVPLLFETQATLPEGGALTHRYGSLDEAREGHARVVGEVEAALGVLDDELETIAKRAAGIPRLPRYRAVKAPHFKPADPNCDRCGGTGEGHSGTNTWGLDTPCDCTVVRRSKHR